MIRAYLRARKYGTAPRFSLRGVSRHVSKLNTRGDNMWQSQRVNYIINELHSED